MHKDVIAVASASTIALMGLLVGCASMPNVGVGYYLPLTSVSLTLTQTASCTAGGIPILKNDLVVAPSYSSDFKNRHVVNLANLGGKMSKATSAFEFYDDGRLKGINVTQTGQGGEVIKSLITLGTSISGGILGGPKPEVNDAVMKLKQAEACKALEVIAGGAKEKPAVADPSVATKPAAKTEDSKESAKTLTIISRAKLPIPSDRKKAVKLVPELDALARAQRAEEDAKDDKSKLSQEVKRLQDELDKKNTPFAFEQNSLPDSLFGAVRPIFGDIKGVVEFIEVAPTHEYATTKGETIQVVEPAKAGIKVTVDFVPQFGKPGEDQNEILSAGANISQLGLIYPLPIQKAPLFGENKLELALSESGRVTKLTYAGNSDPAGMLGAITAITDTQKDPATLSTTDQAKAVQAEADLIYQQQRLVACQANPATCPK